MRLAQLGMLVMSWLVLASPLSAHPGHGATRPHTPVHYVVEPVHAGWVVLGILASLWVLRCLSKLRSPAVAPRRVRHHD